MMILSFIFTVGFCCTCTILYWVFDDCCKFKSFNLVKIFSMLVVVFFVTIPLLIAAYETFTRGFLK